MLIDKLILFWKKSYLWLALGAVLLVLAVMFFRRKTAAGSAVPKEVEMLEKAATGIRTAMAKADNEANVKIIQAEAKDSAVQAQVAEVMKMSDEMEKAKALVALKKTLKS